MNYFETVVPFTNGYYAAIGEERPSDPVALTDYWKQFLWDNVMSEMGEMLLARKTHEQIDALVDAAIYTIDCGLRNGFDQFWDESREDVAPLMPKPMMFHVTDVTTTISEVKKVLQSILLADDPFKQAEGMFALIDLINRKINAIGYPMKPFIKLVADYNNSKLVDGVAIVNAAGKIQKPEGWVAPDKDMEALCLRLSSGA